MSKYDIERRMLNKEEALYYAGFSSTTFHNLQRELGDTFDFPRPHPVNKKYDRKQIDAWLDKTGGVLDSVKTEEQELIERAKSGKY